MDKFLFPNAGPIERLAYLKDSAIAENTAIFIDNNWTVMYI